MENNFREINYSGQNVNILQYLSESNSQFKLRLEYLKKLEIAGVDWKEASRLSKIWYCINFKGCRYTPDVYHKVISYEKKK